MPLYGEPEPPYPEAYAKGVWLFDRRHFFECHEILEALWLESIGTPKTHFQALIHAAVCFVHWENGNRKGVLSLQRTFKQKAESIPAERYMGLNLKRLVADMDALAAPYREAPDKALTPFAEVATPKLEVEGFEPLAVGERELLVLGRHVEEDEDS